MVNIISIISMLGIMISTAALIIILSVFNGMEDLVTKSINSFNPDLKVTIKEGKVFTIDSTLLLQLESLQEVQSVDVVVEDMLLLSYGERQALARLKGCNQNYISVNQIDTLLIDGAFKFNNNSEFDEAVLGAELAAILQINLNSPEFLKCYYPRRLKKNFANPTEAFTTLYLAPLGVFASYTQYDKEYIFCPISFARQLMSYNDEITSIEIKLNSSKELKVAKQKIENILGSQYSVQNKFEQEELLFKTIKNEKLVIFSILTFILFLATFNIVGSLGMLIIEKKEDVAILKFLGASNKLIRHIFLLEGLFISIVGGLLGMVIGFILCFLQQQFHIVKLGNETSNYIISHYPVQMSGIDFLFVLLTVVTISFLASWLPTRKITHRLTLKK
jgi:ABC-type lipoprotein release transport system permease subunit